MSIACAWGPALAAATALAAAAAAQSAQWLVEPRADRPSAVAFDARHGRTVWVHASGTGTARLYEWDGAAVRERLPAPGVIDTVDCMGLDPQTGRRVLLGRNASGYRYGVDDGAGWQWTTTTPFASFNADTQHCYDTTRHRLVSYHPSIQSSLLVEFDGTAWSSHNGGPPLRYAPGFAYDPIGQRCVLYGGRDGSGPLADCWSWDGVAWTQLHAAAPPGARGGAGLGFRSTTGDLVLYGSDTGDTATWLLNGSTWTQVATAHAPGWQRSPRLVPEPGGGMLLLPGPQSSDGDGWRFDGVDWAREPALAAPVFRTSPAYAFDPLRSVVVAYGGASDPRKATMVYDTSWHDVAPVVQPPSRSGAYLAWSPVDQQVLLHGGSDTLNLPLADTWSWDGANWLPRTPSVAPPPRIAAAFCTDPLGGVMLFGGFDGTNVLGDHWRWDGTTWTQIASAVAPPAQYGAVATLDPLRNRVVLVGQAAPGVRGTWEWDGFAWTLMQPTLQPPPSLYAVIGFDPQRGHVVHVGSGMHEWNGSTWSLVPLTGSLSSPLYFVADTGRRRLLGLFHQDSGRVLRLGTVTPDVQAIGTGCALGQAPTLGVAGEPRLGQIDAAFELRDAPPFAPVVVAVGMRAIQQPIGTCTLRVDAVVDWLFEFADAAGSARRQIPIPMSQALRGMRLHVQGFAFDPANSPIASVTFTPALRVAIGD